MRYLGIDFETYSTRDILKCGSYKYMEDPEFEILLMAYAYDDDDVTVIDFTDFEDLPDSVRSDLTNPAVIKTAWNCAFERYAIKCAWGIESPAEQWEDTMILAGQCGLPMSLAGASAALHLKEDEAKMKEGKALIKYFCCPCKPTKTNGHRTRNLPEHAPDKWSVFKKYNGMDVVAERAIRNRLIQYKPLPREHEFWVLDAKINEAGVRIDRQLAENAVAFDTRSKDELTETAVAISGLDNPKSVQQVKNWLADQEGKEIPSLNKKVIADVVSSLQADKSKEFMAIRKELSKSSTAKFNAMLRSMSEEDDHVRGCFKFYGANRTGRFAGSLVQFQNMSKNYMDDIDECRELVRSGDYEMLKCLYESVPDCLSQLVRTAMIPEEGHRFMIADFSAIEARVVAWIADERWRLDTFRNGGDIYCASASQMFHVPVVKHGENGHLRQVGKVAELALGYGGGKGALIAFGADKMGMNEETMQDTVDKWRAASPNIVALWKDLEHTAIKAIQYKCHRIADCGCVSFDYRDGILWMELPSGRRIAYWGAAYDESLRSPGRKSLSYMGVNQQTKKWERVETFSGKLVENCVQATARDVLREAMINCDNLGFDIRAHVHDEIIVTEPIDSGRTWKDLALAMCPEIPWARGLPLRADGYEGNYYFKD